MTSSAPSPRSVCEFNDAVLDHVREHLPTREVEFIPVAGGNGEPLYALTVNGIVVNGTTGDFAAAYTSAGHINSVLGNILPGVNAFQVAVMAVAHATFAAIVQAFPDIPGEVQEYNAALDNRFADLSDGMASAMFDTLSANRRKGASWDTDPVHGLLLHLRAEVDELESLTSGYTDTGGQPFGAVPDEVRERIRSEAADIANMAAMVADKFGALPAPEPDEVEDLGEGDFGYDGPFDIYSTVENGTVNGGPFGGLSLTALSADNDRFYSLYGGSNRPY